MWNDTNGVLMRAEIVVLILSLAAATYSTRVGSFLILRYTGIPEWLRTASRYIPVGVLSALVVPALIAPEGTIDLSFANHYLIAGIAAASALRWKRNMLLALATGFAALTLLSVIG